MKRALVIQTARMGDALQTSPLIRRIRAAHPDMHITALVRRMGRGIVERHPDVDDIITYDEDELFLDLTAGDSDRLLKAYRNADARVRDLRDARFDIAYNATHSLASAMLLRLAEIPEVVGADMSDDWQFILRGPWTTYFFTGVLNREYNDLNLCDIWRNFAGPERPCDHLVFEVRDEDRAHAAALLKEHGIDDNDFVACFQLGASELNKRWAPEGFAGLAGLLREKYRARILLVGVVEEAPLGARMLECAPDAAVPLYGKTSVPQLAALLERASVLVTNDTGTMHVAAAVNCPITLVSVGHVHYRETGPWGSGHCAVERRREHVGRSDFVPGGEEETRLITPEQVMAAVETTLEESAAFPCIQREETPALGDVDLFITRFAPDGCLQFYPVMRRAFTGRDLLRTAYRCMWLEHLQGRQTSKTETESLRTLLRLYNGPDSGTVAAWMREHRAPFEELVAIAKQAAQQSDALVDALKKGRNLERAKTLAADLSAYDERIRVCGEVNPECRPVTLIARFERDNLEGANPEALARATRSIYQNCLARARLMKQKLERVARIFEETRKER